MKMTEAELREQGFIIENVRIKAVDLSMEDQNYLALYIVLDNGDCTHVYGGQPLGYNCEDTQSVVCSAYGIEFIMRILNLVGVSRFQELEGKYVRVAHKGVGRSITIIGNILKDEWFDAYQFFNEVAK